MIPWIKICGVRTEADVRAAHRAGADAIGLVHHAGSPRHLTPDEARALSARVPAGLEVVGVFLRPTQRELDAMIEACRPARVQLDADVVGTLRIDVPVLPVVRGPSTARLVEPGARCVVEGPRSGAGERADWTFARSLRDRCSVVLAGGLTPDNVEEALRLARPFGLDVSSGVERTRGIKDPDRIAAFVRAARSAP